MPATWTDDTGDLWHLNYKINTDFRGFNFKLHVRGANEAAARAIAIRLGLRMLNVLPLDAEIVMATLNKDDSDRDSRMVPDVFGPGLYVAPSPATPPSVFDNSRTCLNFRLEHSAGSGITRKWAPLPDVPVSAQALTTAIAGMQGIAAGPTDAPGAAASWFLEMKNFIQDIAFSTQAIKSGHAPGGPFKYATFVNAYVMRVDVKRGARVFA